MPQVIAGRHAVLHALRAGRRQVRQVWLLDRAHGPAIEEALSLADERGVPVERAGASFFRSRVPLETHQGVAAEVAPLPYITLDELIGQLEPVASSRVLLLDGIEDPHNLGALMRSAHCFGIDAVIWPERRSAPLSVAAAKAASGAVEYLALCPVNNLVTAIDGLKEVNFWVYGAIPEGGESLWEVDFPPKAALIIGGEGAGLRRLVRKQCDHFITIPMESTIGSLNASVAGGILMSHFGKKRPT